MWQLQRESRTRPQVNKALFECFESLYWASLYFCDLVFWFYERLSLFSSKYSLTYISSTTNNGWVAAQFGYFFKLKMLFFCLTNDCCPFTEAITPTTSAVTQAISSPSTTSTTTTTISARRGTTISMPENTTQITKNTVPESFLSLIAPLLIIFERYHWKSKF